MPDPYRLDDGVTPASTASLSRRSARSPLRPLLWMLLTLSVTGNTLASLGVIPTVLAIVFGVLTAICVTALIVVHVRRR